MNYDEFKNSAQKIPGIINQNYLVAIQIPKTYVDDAEQQDIGINPHSLREDDLQKAGYFASSITIAQIYTDEVVVEFTLSEPFLQKFYNKVINVNGAKIIEKEQ